MFVTVTLKLPEYITYLKIKKLKEKHSMRYFFYVGISNKTKNKNIYAQLKNKRDIWCKNKKKKTLKFIKNV